MTGVHVVPLRGKNRSFGASFGIGLNRFTAEAFEVPVSVRALNRTNMQDIMCWVRISTP